MKIKVTISNPNSIRFFKPGSNWVSLFVSIREIMEESDNHLSNTMIRVNPSSIKAAGNVSFEPHVGGEYILIGDYIKGDYGWQFQIEGGYENIQLNSFLEKKMFLEQILTERQVTSLYNTFEDPFEYVKDENVEKLMEAKYIGEHTANRIIDKFKSTMDLAPAYNFFRPLGVTPLLITKLCETYGGAEEAINKFKKNPYILVDDVKGVGFLRADEIALKYNIKPNSPFRIKSGIRYLFKNIAQEEGSTWLKLNNFESSITELLQLEFQVIEPIMQEMIKDEEVYYKDDKIALMYYYELEKKIVNKLLNLQKADCKTYEEDDIEKGISRAQEEQGFDFTDEQLDGIKSIISNNVSLVVGLAGTGKTSIIKGAYKVFPYNTIIKQCAFSGQAAKRINEATNYPSSTIHRLLGFQGEQFTYNINNPLSADVIILDEVSMVGLELFWSLLQAIPYGAKLIMLGDNGQLPPIGVGNLLSDLMDSNKINLINLTKIHRQAEKSAIITTSQKVRKKVFLLSGDYEGEETYGQLRDLNLIAKQEKDNLFDVLISTFMDEYKKNNNNSKDVQIIVAQNSKVALARDQINKEIQNKINPKRFDSEKEISIKYKQVIRINDKIINRENHYDVETPDGIQTSIYNGSMGVVKEIGKNYALIDFFDEGEIIIPSEYYSGLELAYAITCHSSQGSQFKVVIVGFDNSSYILLSNEWLYTAITRAKDMCYIITQTRALNMSVTKNKIVDRDTFLPELFGEIE